MVVARTLPIVVGAHLLAEANHRALADDLRLACEERLDGALVPIVCTDLWYLNNDDLRRQPTICIGAPGLNALTAFLADKLPTAFAIDDRLAIQYDPEFADHACAVWGVDTPATAEAVALFIDKHLDTALAHFADV